jgi:agmatine/peptidylarginine deiminase
MFRQKRLIAEFEEQTFTQIIFPHQETDWAEYLEEAEKTFVNIINAVRKQQPCLLVCYDINAVKKHFDDHTNLLFVEYQTDDTWARDCSAITIEENGQKKLLDFQFNAWGGKFEAAKDNRMSKALAPYYKSPVQQVDFVLEGGAIESNGEGILLTTAQCMLNKNRNPHLNAAHITDKLKEFFGSKTVFYLKHGYLAGDDTDSHIDTLARFTDKQTIMYVQCRDKNDEHFAALQKMQAELQAMAKEQNFTLIPLPLPSPLYYKGERLPATYANFLFVNGAVLVPVYGVKEDEEALKIFQDTFQERSIIPLDCSILIRQHGSLHCISMNFHH